MLAHAGKALVVVQDTVAQARAKHVLQVGEALEAERAGKAHERRGRHVGARRDARHRAEGDLVGIVERVARHLHEAPGQALGPFRDQGGERRVVLRRRGLCVHGASGAMWLRNIQSEMEQKFHLQRRQAGYSAQLGGSA